MPTLPSGRTPALSMNHILPPGVVTFKCPEGHFWFQKPDLALSPRPYEPNAKGVLDEIACPAFENRGNSKHVLELRSEDGRT